MTLIFFIKKKKKKKNLSQTKRELCLKVKPC